MGIVQAALQNAASVRPPSYAGEPMFWKRFHEDSELDPRAVRSYVRHQLRVAFTFATLGAYDEHGDIDATSPSEAPCEATDVEGPAWLNTHAERTKGCEAPGRRRRSGSTSAGIGCTAPDEPRRCRASVASERSAVRLEGRRLTRRRTGSVAVPEQPCLWVGH